MATDTNKKIFTIRFIYTGFTLKFIFALQDTPVHTELENEQAGEEEGTVDEPEKMPEGQQPPHRKTPLQK